MKRRILNKQSRILQLVATTTLSVLIAGCQNADHPNTATTNASPLFTSTATVAVATPAPQPTMIVTSEEMREYLLSTIDDQTTAENQTTENDSLVDADPKEQIWRTENPQIAGIALKQPIPFIDDLYGPQIDSYHLEEPAGRLLVLEYSGLSVGINKEDVVEFVDVFEANIDLGLNGLAIGNTPELAIEKLGKPDNQSTYLLTYSAADAILKIDIDPQSNTIVSIKLLPQT